MRLFQRDYYKSEAINFIGNQFNAISDENGPYYWHVKSGNIQREPPEAPLHTKTEARRSLVKDNDSVSDVLIIFIILFIFYFSIFAIFTSHTIFNL